MFGSFRHHIAHKIALGVGLSCLIVSLVGLAFMAFTGKPAGYSPVQVVAAVLLSAFVTLITMLVVRIYLSQPLQKLTRAVESAKQGNFLTRAEVGDLDELGQLARNFNHLLTQLTDIQASKIDTDIELEYVQRELKFKAQLEEMNRTIEDTNRKLTRRLSDLALLYDINRSLISTLDLNEVIKVLAEKIGGALGFDEFTVLLMDPQSKKLILRSTLDKLVPIQSVGKTIDPMPSLFAEALRMGQSITIEDLSQISQTSQKDELLPAGGSVLIVPMIYKDQTLGLLNFVRTNKSAFTQDEEQLLTSVTQQAAMAVLNAQLYQEKSDLSITDELTQLANRRQMQNRLDREWNRAKRNQTPLSLLMIDIDHFKRYNDINGHLLGDQVLRRVARILEENTRKVDTVARFGGEEFVVILPEQDKSTASSVADKLRRAVFGGKFKRAHRQPGGHLTISVGVSSYPDDAEDPQVLLDLSDLALYVAKNSGRDRTVSYERGMQQVEEERRRAMQEKKARRRRRKRSKPRLEFMEPT